MNDKPPKKVKKKKVKTPRIERLRDLKTYNWIIILPDDPVKLRWDILISILLIMVFFITPYRIAFTDDEPWYWIIID